MNATTPDLVDQVIRAVQKGERYRNIYPGLVRSLAAAEITKGRSFKEAVKATRSKLHQVGGAYIDSAFPVKRWVEEMEDLPADLQDAGLKEFCRKVMQNHASTRERLPILHEIFNTILRPLLPIRSVLDLACGLNPLAQAWMPFDAGTIYHACDIYTDLLAVTAAFNHHIGRGGEVFACDLTGEIPACEAQVAFLLKAIPCLEQVDRGIGVRLLEEIPADHLLVTFPAHSLGGRSKGMLKNYEAHFWELTEGKNWRIQRFIFPGELAFLISR